MFFMPPRPYLPAGTLRDAIDYPVSDPAPDDAMITEALLRVGLERLVARLDERSKWNQVLTAEDQQRLGFARLLLKRPDWIFLEEAVDSLTPAGQQAMIALLREEFPEDAVIAIGHSDALAGAETRRFLLQRIEGVVTVREDKVQPAQSWA
jgi:putative ATP-binding cassette transporter